MRINRKILITLCLILCFIQPVYSYELVSKEHLIYEIQTAQLSEKGISIEGWSFIGESQHFNNTNEFSGTILLDNGKSKLEYPLNFKRKDMTNLMKMGNPRKCGANEYNKKGRECYYDYSMVGWNVFIPIEDLMDDARYKLRICMKALKSGQEYETPVIIANEFQAIDDTPRQRVVSINSAINNTRVLVNHDFVMVRKAPAKNAEVYYAQKPCSLTYGSVLYFIKYTEFLRVKNYKPIDDVTWYQVGVDEIGCYNSKASVMEGERLAWIPSTYVSYNGTVATIDVVNTYTAPIIYLENQTIYVGDTSFNPDDYVTAYDAYDGVIIPIRKRTNLNVFKVGRYYVQYYATNSKNKTTSKMMYVDVIEKEENTPPIISAFDQTLYQNDTYNPMYNVNATDLEDGDLTQSIILTNSVDTSKIGVFNQCYYVEDSKGLSDETCVKITVLPKLIPPIYQHNSIRFIDSNRPFYKERIPIKWSNLINQVISSANSSSVLRRGRY